MATRETFTARNKLTIKNITDSKEKLNIMYEVAENRSKATLIGAIILADDNLFLIETYIAVSNRSERPNTANITS
jgi:hypothetical protein